MVYHSVPDPNKTYPHHMENFETAKFDIQKVFYTADGSLVDRVEAIATIYQTIEMKFDRDQMISQMRQQGCGVYFKDKKLHIDWVNMTPYIHPEKSAGSSRADCRLTDTRDILE